MTPHAPNPVSPGEILTEDFIKPLELHLPHFAKQLGWSLTSLRQVLKGIRRVDHQMARDLSRVLGTSWELWDNLQSEYDRRKRG